MTSTPDLIQTLADNITPVRRLRPPLLRASLWLLLAVAVLALLAVSQGVRSDLTERLGDADFLGCVLGALATGVTGALSAFTLSLPDRSRWWVMLPVPTLIFWFSNVGYTCLTDWVALDPGTITPGETARCFATLVLASLPLSLAMLIMLRHAVAIRPMTVAMIGSLAVAALTAAALSLFHVIDASLLVIMWNMGTALLIVGAGGLLTRRYTRKDHLS